MIYVNLADWADIDMVHHLEMNKSPLMILHQIDIHVYVCI